MALNAIAKTAIMGQCVIRAGDQVKLRFTDKDGHPVAQLRDKDNNISCHIPLMQLQGAVSVNWHSVQARIEAMGKHSQRSKFLRYESLLAKVGGL